jgi:hypothetical protein
MKILPVRAKRIDEYEISFTPDSKNKTNPVDRDQDTFKYLFALLK